MHCLKNCSVEILNEKPNIGTDLEQILEKNS
jgi:hypothetical protein